MEHPVPQNITSFEFHLVGDMTLKQFGYLAAGFIIAYISFTVLLPINVALSLPIIVVSVLTGAAFAFVPIFDRPLDHWLMVFLRAVYQPTQGSWKPRSLPGNKKITEDEPLFQNRLQKYLSSIGAASPILETPRPTAPSLPKMTRITPLPPVMFPPKPTVPQTTPPPVSESQPTPQLQQIVQHTPAIPPIDQNIVNLMKMAEEARLLQARVAETERQIKLMQNISASQEAKTPEFTQKLQVASQNLQNLAQQTGNLYQQTIVPVTNHLPAGRQDQSPVTIPAPVPPPQKADIVVVEPQKEAKQQPMLTSLPNVISGVITDDQGNYIEGVIVIIHNAEGIPVRAIKTNKIGQFNGSTPLPSGIYTITMEKDNFKFDTLQITLTGELIAPFTIHPKKGDVK